MKATVLLVLCFLLPIPTFAWGKEGHEIVAYLAYDMVSPATRIRLNHLLSDVPGTVGPELMVEAAFWPDEIKKHPGTPVTIFTRFRVRNAAGTHPFHYADMAGEHFDPATDAERGKSVVSAIERCKEVLQDSHSSRDEQREALKFLVHFVGDIHQPLHAGRKADKGGNDIHLVAFLNRHPAKGFNLHEVWDSLLIQSKSRDSQRYAERLRAGLSKPTIAKYLTEQKSVKWLEASHALAMSNAYVDGKGKAIVSGVSLGQVYAVKNLPIVDEQLSKVGVRLAALLDQLFR